MTDKKKIDEAVTLTMNGTDENGAVTVATIQANDVAELASILKRAGIAGNSGEFNGPATLSSEDMNGNTGISVTTTATSLRAIMQMLEPEFAADAETEYDIENQMQADLAAQNQMDQMDAEQDDDDIVDPVINADNDLEIEIGADGSLEMPGTGDEIDAEVEEEADYDYRTHDTAPTEFAGKASREVVQPKTHYVPARSGDNPIEENAHGGSDTYETSMEIDGWEYDLTVVYSYNDGSFDTGLDHPSTHSDGGELTIEQVINKGSGLDILDDLDQNVIDRLKEEIYEHGDDYDYNEAVAPKSFRDYVQEAEKLAELSRTMVRGYVDSANAQDYDAEDEKLLKKRYRGLSTAASKLHWKDANVLATEEEQLDELSPDTLSSYAHKATQSKDKHEKKSAILDDLVGDAAIRLKTGLGNPNAKDRLEKARNRHDRAAWKREKGLDRLTGYKPLDEISAKTKASYIKKSASEIEAGQKPAKADKRRAGIRNALGGVKHTDLREGNRDWTTMSDAAINAWLAANDTEEAGIGQNFARQIKTAREEVQRRQMTEANNETPKKNRYVVGSRMYEPYGYAIIDSETKEVVSGNFDDRRHADYEAAIMNGADPHELLGDFDTNDDATGIEESESKYSIKTTDKGYEIVDNTTGETVEDNIHSGHEAHNSLYYWNKKKESTTGVNEAPSPFKEFPDTEEGAKDAFVFASIYKPSQIVNVEADPYVENVWLITTKARDGVISRHILYLKGVDQRGGPDFETVDESVNSDNISEASYDSDEYDRKNRQFGEPYYLNTDCGFASLEMIRDGNAEYFDGRGVTVLAINRGGKWGYNYITSYDNIKDDTPVTAITQTNTGVKRREGKVITTIDQQEIENDWDGLCRRLAALGITPSKKLSVKTFD